MAEKANLRIVKSVGETASPRHLRRLIVTIIAILAVLAAVVLKAKLLGEFTWYIGW